MTTICGSECCWVFWKKVEQQLWCVVLGVRCSERKRNNSNDVCLWVLGVLKERGTMTTICGSECCWVFWKKEEQQQRCVSLSVGCSEIKRNNNYDVWLWVLGVLKERGTTTTMCGFSWLLGVLKERVKQRRCVALCVGCSERKRNNSYDVWLWVLCVLKERGTMTTICGSECCWVFWKKVEQQLWCVVLGVRCSERKRNNSNDVCLWVLGVLKERRTIATMCGYECWVIWKKEEQQLRCVVLSDWCSERKRNTSYDVWFWVIGVLKERGTPATMCVSGCWVFWKKEEQ